MRTHVPACPTHRTLVERALDPEAPDDVLEAYAAEVPACEDCRRELARTLQVHPAVLTDAGAPPSVAGMEALRDALAPAPRRWPAAAAAAGALVLAAAASWLIFAPAPRGPAPADPPAPIDVVQDAPVQPTPGTPAPSEAAPTTQPEPRAPSTAHDGPPPPAPARVEPPASVVAANTAFDWPAPPFVELRHGTAKGVGSLRAVQLVLGGGGPQRHVGDVVSLTIVASAPTELAVCVSGPERGIVWRGGVPAGRVELTRSGKQASFAFAAPGTYRFAVTTADLERCDDAVHVVEVEVNG